MMCKRLSDYRVIVLDMDGTLYYQAPLRICMGFSLALYYALHLMDIKELFILRDYRKSHNNGGAIDIGDCGEISERYKVPAEKIDNIVNYWMQDKPLKYIRIFRDKKLLKLINHLQQNGAKIVIYSDYPVFEKVKALGVLRPDYCFSSSDEIIRCLKPDPKGLTEIIALINEPVDHFVFIGDRYEKDGQCAEQVGMDYLILGGNSITRYLFKSKFWRTLTWEH